jgi:ribosomal protection tetracycline resistance protein
VYGVPAVFEPSQLVHLERPTGTGSAVELIGHGFAATVGLRVEPAAPGTGVVFRREVELGALLPAFNKAVEESVGQALEQGRYGWPVTDVKVTLTHCGYWAPITIAGDFRDLTPLVLAQALARAGTRVYEPCHRFEVEVPPGRLGSVTGALVQLGARIDDVAGSTDVWRIVGEIPARAVRPFQQRLPGLASGEGVWSAQPAGDRQLLGAPPTRKRSDGNPYDRTEYVRFLSQRSLAAATA